MPSYPTTQCLLFPGLFRQLLVARFDQEHGSSDGGAILLKAADQQLRLTAQLATCIEDRREPGKITHELVELLAQRIFGIACGYPDANDAARLADDPIHKLLLDRDPIDGSSLASQPTLSRFENAPGVRELVRIGRTLAETVIERHRHRLWGRARRITLDLDVTRDATHGTQQLSFFNGYYDTWCYLPLLGFLSFDDEPDQFLFAAVLRPGNAPDKQGVLPILKRVLPRLRAAFPKARIRVRLDGGFASPEILEFLDAEPRVDYVVGMAKNKVLKRLARRFMARARHRSRLTGRTAHVYAECLYQARTWAHPRRVIIKAEVVRYPGREPKDNPRFVITNLKQAASAVYQKVYCDRGEIENRIKELHHGMGLGRTSCSRFRANQLRVLLTAAAYLLMQELRLHARNTVCARAQVSTLRDRLLKIGAWIAVSVRRIVIHLPTSTPYRGCWNHVACSLGARAG
jgi:hypothetical protein